MSSGGTATTTCPVSQRLLDDLTADVRRHGLVIWLDKDGVYSDFVDNLVVQGPPFPVVAFRKSFVELLLALEPFGNALDKQHPLVVHMPGYNEANIRKTPILELYDPGARFRKSLDTLVREVSVGRVPPAEVDAFVGKGPTLREADTWLSEAALRNASGLEGILQATGEALVVQALAGPSSALHERIKPEDVPTLQTYLEKLTGLDEAWVGEFAPPRSIRAGVSGHHSLDEVLDALGAWLLCVEYVHDLKRPPHLQSLARLRDVPKPLVKKASDILDQLRLHHADAYVRLAEEGESFLKGELEAMTADDLGQIDTFRAEENCVLDGAVKALQEKNWQRAAEHCRARSGDRSFWLRRDQSRRWAWSLVDAAASFGQTIAAHAHPLAGVRSLTEAVERYAGGAFKVDLAHRRWEQFRLSVETHRMPHYGPLQEVALELRRLHRAWADDLARAFTACCEKEGFLPPTSLRQRTLYEEVVQPLTQTGDKVAVFMIDAFRYEMATELLDDLKATGTVVDLKARLAELPTITSVGMNVLAPVAQGEKLVVVGTFGGFKSGEYTVRTPETRARSMGTRSVGQPALLLKLADVCEATPSNLSKRLGQHRLVVVHSKEIDDAGEANIGLPTFETTLRQIKAAWHHLQTAGVKHVVFTADHGFLLQDETTVLRKFGKKTDPSRRHVLDDQPRQEKGMVPVSLSSLGYEGLGGYLLFREDTAVFDTGTPGANFVHGGNSPQERIIPVLTVTRERAEGSSFAEYMVEATSDTDVLGLHRIRVRVGFAKGTTTGLGFATAKTVDLGLEALKRPDVQIVVREVGGPGALDKGRLRLPVGGAWSEVFFVLEGPKDEHVQVAVTHPEKIEKVQPAEIDTWFTVSGLAAGKSGAAATPDAPMTWADAISDEAVRKVFLHIEKHGSITEPEVTRFVGSPRSFRRFSMEFENHVTKLPFKVRIEPGEGGKRYVREGDR